MPGDRRGQRLGEIHTPGPAGPGEEAGGRPDAVPGPGYGGDRRFPRQVLGYVPQDSQLALELTAGEQLALWRAACGLRGPVQEELIALLGLEGLLKRRLGELSGGMRQRVSIAMALSTGREVLALDEASSGLDEGYREGLLSWMENFLAGGGCAVWCTHLPDELERLCTSCMTLREGRAYWGDGPVPL